MENIGRSPSWKPSSVGDRILTSIFTLWYYICFIPMWVLTKTFGWSKINWIVLDVLSIPGKLLYLLCKLLGKEKWGLKANALEHTHFVCRMCPASRQATRDPLASGLCRWNRRWNEGKFDIPQDFGSKNYFLQYIGKMNLKEYRNLVDKKDK